MSKFTMCSWILENLNVPNLSGFKFRIFKDFPESQSIQSIFTFHIMKYGKYWFHLQNIANFYFLGHFIPKQRV
jgi:hypothetical protein